MPNSKTAPRAAEPGLARRENGFVDPCMAAASAAVGRHCFSENSALISFLRILGFLRKLRSLSDKLSFLRNSAFQKPQLLSAFEGNPGISFEKNLSFYQLLGPLCSYRALGKAQLFVQLSFQKTQLLSAFCEDNGWEFVKTYILIYFNIFL